MLSCDFSFLEPAIILSFLLHMSNKVLSSVFLHLRMSTLCPHVHFYLNIKVTPYTDELPICFGFYNLFFFLLHTTSCLKCIYLQEVHFLSFCIKFYVCVCVCARTFNLKWLLSHLFSQCSLWTIILCSSLSYFLVLYILCTQPKNFDFAVFNVPNLSPVICLVSFLWIQASHIVIHCWCVGPNAALPYPLFPFFQSFYQVISATYEVPGTSLYYISTWQCSPWHVYCPLPKARTQGLTLGQCLQPWWCKFLLTSTGSAVFTILSNSDINESLLVYNMEALCSFSPCRNFR